MVTRVVVIGGVAAGMKAAAVAKRRDPALDVCVFQDEPDVSYSACGLPYHLADPDVIPRNKIIARTVDRFRADGIDLRVRHRVDSVDLSGRRVTVTDLSSGAGITEHFDLLLFATGARPIETDLAVGAGAPALFKLRSIGDADLIRPWLGQAKRAVILGGGYIGLELAETCRARGVSVTVVEMAPRLLPGFQPWIGDRVTSQLEQHGVDILLGRRMTAAKSGRVILDDGTSLDCDGALVCIGVRPNVDLASSAGLRLGRTGAIAVDPAMRASAPGVFAAGDCCEAHHLISGAPVWYPLGDVANRQGRVAGTNLAGGDAWFPGVLGTAIFRAFDLAVARTGFTCPQAQAAGFEAIDVRFEAPSRARYMPTSRPLAATLTAERTTGRVLGAEAVGEDAVDKFIDVIATAVWSGLTVDDLSDLDLAYAPPFSPLFAPVQVGGDLIRKREFREPAMRSKIAEAGR
ncbi:MAG: FAD-dependent oxidoreductase [Betaproteobacteria bacterium]|nr:FAD-dependent oxidoreductase [Betaproteobacteria bacterium]